MMKPFTNVSAVEIGGKKPTQKFLLRVSSEGQPEDRYWRKRLAEGAIAPVAPARSDQPAPAEKAAPRSKKGSTE